MVEGDLLIEPRRGRNEALLPERAVMVVNPAEAEQALQMFKPLAGESRTMYQTEIVVDKDNSLCLAGPALGAPAAVLVLEKLIVLGVKQIWLVSCCGVIDPLFAIGDLLIGGGALSGEGVSRYYSEQILSKPDPQVTARLGAIAREITADSREACVWSTDAPYRERRSELTRLKEQFGVSGVDMEFSALCTVASYRKVSLGGIFVVSDLLWGQRWKPGFGTKEFRRQSLDLIEHIIHYGLSRER